jgi:hypothetical protein
MSAVVPNLRGRVNQLLVKYEYGMYLSLSLAEGLLVATAAFKYLRKSDTT